MAWRQTCWVTTNHQGEKACRRHLKVFRKKILDVGIIVPTSGIFNNSTTVARTVVVIRKFCFGSSSFVVTRHSCRHCVCYWISRSYSVVTANGRKKIITVTMTVATVHWGWHRSGNDSIHSINSKCQSVKNHPKFTLWHLLCALKGALFHYVL